MKQVITVTVCLEGTENIELDDRLIAPTLHIENVCIDFYNKMAFKRFRKALADELGLIVPEASAEPEQVAAVVVGKENATAATVAS